MWNMCFGKCFLIFFKFYLLILGVVNTVKVSYDSQPKISYEKGELVIESANNRNLSFQLSGRQSRLNLNDTDLGKILGDLEGYIHAIGHTKDLTLEDQIINIRRSLFSANGIAKRLMALENGTLANNRTTRPVNDFLRTVQRIAVKIQTIESKITVDDCVLAPCQNGGICTDLFDNYMCECRENWQGNNCDVDVNECAFFMGTDLGCQNEAQCVNTLGSYYCVCTNGWIGLHCTQKSNNCYTAPVGELCGNGICINSNTDVGYECICDQGWKTDGINPACTVDVDECKDSAHSPCITNCTNIPGSFRCEACPPGLTGNGQHCDDIDECLVDNGGCSTSPTVHCINTLGSYHCGPCPGGWRGDGKNCERAQNARCSSTNLCSPSATCQEISDIVVCVCPPGSVGDGIGPNGCVALNLCSSNPCLNGGTCSPRGNTFICICPPGTDLPRCTVSEDPCSNQPCLNGGTCVRNGTRFSCLCRNGLSGRICSQTTNSCGGILIGSTGTLKYPQNSTYQHNERCAWIIRVNSRKVINVTFQSFDLEFSAGCRYDWLQIHDGRSSAYQLIGRFCGTDKPKNGTIISTTNQLYLWFRTDNSTTHEGFRLSWKSIDPFCGGIIENATLGTLNSPGYPGHCAANRDCEWIILVPPGKRLELTFFEIKLGYRFNCTGDTLTIYEGRTSVEPIFEKFCNFSQPAPMIIPVNEILMVFHTDSIGNDASFQAHYALKEGIPGCGGYFSAPSGEFGTPEINGNYPNNIVCEYIIHVQLWFVVEINFKSFDLERSGGCRNDRVEIFDGKTDEDPLIYRWCGFNIPPKTRSLTNFILIKFTSDSTINREGFSAAYLSKCEKSFSSPKGTIISPNYPNNYPSNIDCSYTIFAPRGHVIELTFVDFWLEGHAASSLPFDYVQIDFGTVDSNMNTSQTYSGRDLPTTLVSATNYVKIKFHSDITIEYSGFNISYEFIDIGCGGILRDISGQITPPMTESGYRHNLTCTWILSANDSRFIQLSFTRFDLQESLECSRDYLEISYQLPNKSSVIRKRYCGQSKPAESVYTTNMVVIKFKTDFGETGSGFEIEYNFIDKKNHCGGNFTDPTGEIQSPGWPSRYNIDLRVDCEWIIHAPSGNKIELIVKTFGLEHNNDCLYDYLEIRNGMLRTSPLIGRYCGSKIPQRIPSYTNHLYLHFRNDISYSLNSFNIEWDSLSTGCGGDMVSAEGTIISPNYPNIPTEPVQCEWRIKVNTGSRMNITIKYLYNPILRCDNDLLTIYDGPHQAMPVIHKSCGWEAFQQNVTTSSNQAFIRLSTINITGGFILHFKINCDVELRSFYGVIESPGYPNKYLSNLECTWRIIARPGNRISVSVSNFDLQTIFGSNSCSTIDYIKFSDKRSGETISESIHCSSKPNDFTTVGEILEIKFVSGDTVNAPGFRLEFQIDGCGDVLTQPVGFISSPGYPDKYSLNAYCEWIIQGDYGQVIQVTLQDIFLEPAVGGGCQDELLISNGRSATNILLQLCITNSTNQVVTSNHHEIYIRFRTNGVRRRKYFKAKYQFTQASCGGRYTTDNAFLYSPNYPKNYPPDLYCEYIIETDPHHELHTSIEYRIEDSENCSKDSLTQIQKFAISNQVVNSTMCGHGNYIMDGGNSHRIIFRTDHENTGIGFLISYYQLCGAHIKTESSGVIKKPFDRRRCKWTIEANNTHSHVTLSFRHVQCFCEAAQSDEECENSSGAKIFDPSASDNNLVTSFCRKHPPDITSIGNSLRIASVSAYFEAFYSVYDYACGGTFTSIHGQFATPAFPATYPVNVECIWNVEAREGNFIDFFFEIFDLANSYQCSEDYLEIREDDMHGKLIGAYCGSDKPPMITGYRKLWMKFQSNDDNVVGNGFKVEFSYARDNTLNASRGSIECPAFYNSDDFLYTWRIIAGLGNTTQIIFREYSSGLKIYDGYDETATEIEFSPTDRQVQTTTGATFLTADPKSSTHFKLDWITVPRVTNNVSNQNISNCSTDGELIILDRNETLRITSPNYPEKYPNNLNCSWIFKSNDSRYHVIMLLADIDLESTPDCWADYIIISHSHDMVTWTDGRKMCRPEHYFTLMEIFHGAPYLKIKFFADVSKAESGFVAHIYVECGGNLTDPSGVIHGNSTRTQWLSTCVWSIKVRPNRKIQFNFDYIQIPDAINDGHCDFYVTIRNGKDAESPYLGIGRYCATQAHEIPLTTSNRAFIQCETNVYVQTDWELRYNEVAEECGGDDFRLLNHETKFVISSPNYPNIPDPFTDCTWIFTVPPGESVNLTFIDRFDLLRTPFCDSEYIEVRDGSTSLARLLRKFCTNPIHVMSTGNVLYLKYFTQAPDPRNGFKAVISVAKCGGTFSQNTGEIKSFNFPFPGAYPKNSVCEYRIRSTLTLPRYGVTLNFTDLDLPFSTTATENDNLIIYALAPIEGGDFVENQLSQLDGNSTMQNILSWSPNVLIRFKTSNANINSRGWRLTYRISDAYSCSQDFTTERGEFKTPFYPHRPRTAMYCIWRITVPHGRRIKLEITLAMEVVRSPFRRIPYMNNAQTMPLGRRLGFPRLRRQLRPPTVVTTPLVNADPHFTFYNDFEYRSKIITNETQPDPVIYSVANRMLVKCMIKENSRIYGARFQYSSGELSLCQGNLNYSSGNIANLSLPAYYCEYRANLNENQTIGFKIQSLMSDLNLAYCSRTQPIRFIETQRRPLFSVCGNFTNKYLAFPNRDITLQILRSHLTGNVTFSMDYKRYNCGGIRTLQYELNITNPSDAGNVVGSIDCSWRIDARLNMINFSAIFDLKLQCDKEFVKIYAGSDPSGPLVGKFCGNTTLGDNRSYNNVFIHYHSEQTILGSTFTISTRMKSNCGGNWRVRYNLFVKIEKNDYRNNMDCIWTIQGPSNVQLSVAVIGRFFIEGSPNCTKDFLEIGDLINNDFFSVGRFCGREIPEIINATSDRIQIRFKTDNTILGDGFKLKINENCGGIYHVTDETKFIASPGYPNSYLPNLYCNYTLVTDQEKTIYLKFDEFHLETSRQCKFDNLTIYTPELTGNPKSYCQLEALDEVRSTKYAHVIFQSDGHVERTGFKFFYHFDRCGGVITQTSTISTPKNMDGTYPHNMHCIWNITAPHNKMIIIRFEKFEYEQNFDCSNDFVEIYSGTTLDENKRKGKFCGNLTTFLSDLKIRGQNAIILSKTDISVSGEGFSAIIFIVEDCDQDIRLTSPGNEYRVMEIPANYSNNLDCHYQFIAPDGYQLKIEFQTMNLSICSREPRCNCDYIELRDGGGSLSDLVGRYCNGLPRQFISSQTQLYLRFVSDETMTAGGLKFNVSLIRSVCGPSNYELNGTNSQTVEILSPGWPNDYPPNTKCTWVIQANRQLNAIVEFMDLEPADENNQCRDYIEINQVHTNQEQLEMNSSLVVNSRDPNYYGAPSMVRKHIYCGNQAFEYFTFFSVNLLIKFSSDAENQRKGFKLTAKLVGADCSRNYTQLYGRMKLWENTNCTIFITVPENYTITLDFGFMVLANRNCVESFLEIFDQRNSFSLKKWCETALPNPLFTNTSVLKIITKFQQFDEVMVSYIASNAGSGCGGDIFDYNGRFTSPMYPSNEYNGLNCTWNIEVPSNNRVGLTFLQFDMGSKATCGLDYVQLLDKNERGEMEMMRQYCGEDQPSVFVARANTVQVRYVKTTNFDGTGWVLVFNAVLDENDANNRIQKLYLS